MPGCKYRKLQVDGSHGNCYHPEAQPGDTCILDESDECVLREDPEGEEQ